MPTPSPAMVQLLDTFAPAFTAPTFAHARTLACGAILSVGQRTVAAALRAVGLAQERHDTTYHRVLNRARWSPVVLSRLLLGVIITAFAPEGPLVLFNPLIYLNSESNYTMALGLTQYAIGHSGTAYNLQMAAATAMTIPVILLFFFAQRYFMQGIVTTGLAAR